MQTKPMPSRSALKALCALALAGGANVTTQTMVNRRAFDDLRVSIKRELVDGGLVSTDVNAAPFGHSTATLHDEFWSITPEGIALLKRLNQ